MNMTDKFFVYLLLCSDNSLYCGWTNDLESRIAAHNAGRGAKYTKSRRPVKLVYFEEHESKSAAMKREWQIKRLSRKEKILLAQSNLYPKIPCGNKNSPNPDDRPFWHFQP